MTNETIFIAANNGGLEIYKGVGNLIAGNIKTAKTFKYMMDAHHIDPDVDTIYTTSDMDFADECGFDHYDDARILMEEGLKLMEMTKEY